jgi:hypothetical protein
MPMVVYGARRKSCGHMVRDMGEHGEAWQSVDVDPA